MSYLERLTEDMKTAMKSGEKDRLSTIRLLRGSIKDAEINKRKTLSEEEEIAVLSNAAKKRRESIAAYQQAGRLDLVAKEQAELVVIQSYLPEQLSQDELQHIVEAAIVESGAQSLKDMGKVMALVMTKAKGRADGKLINEIVRSKLSV